MPTAKVKDRFVIFMGMFIAVVALGGAVALGDYSEVTPEEEDPGWEWVTASFTAIFDDSVVEGDSNTEGIALDEKKVTQVTFTLTWEDEPSDSRHTNTPDTLKLEVESEFGSDSQENSAGMIEFTFTAPEDKPWDMEDKDWNVTITAVDCGDHDPLVPDPFGFRTVTDGGNSYKLEVEIQYEKKEKKVST